ncbi:MAG: hypothetical protein M0002_19265 [Rhodospirillales bacterium]|nr:hypothetical protein [Rhodospirillales bacterium]
MRRRFLVLRAFSLVLRLIGWLLVIAGLVVFVIGVIGLLRASPGMIGVAAAPDMLGGGFGTMLAGFIFVLYGEVIEIFFDIEANTRRTAELIERLAAPLPPAPRGG